MKSCLGTIRDVIHTFIGHLSLGVHVIMQRASPCIQKSEDNLACLRSGFLFAVASG